MGALKASGGLRIGRSLILKATPVRNGLVTETSSSSVGSFPSCPLVRGIARSSSNVVPTRGSVASCGIVSSISPISSVRSSVCFVSSSSVRPGTSSRSNVTKDRDVSESLVAIARMSRANLPGDARSSRSEKSNWSGRSIAPLYVDQEEEFASTVELVEASSSNELWVATVTLFPSFWPGS